MDDIFAELARRYTYRGTYTLASGRVADAYVDLRALSLRHPTTVRIKLRERLAQFETDNPDGVVATGAAGAILLALLATDPLRLPNHWTKVGWLWNPKDHGVPWSPLIPGTARVVLVDDLRTTGGTLKRLGEACQLAGLVVLGETVLLA